jgi:hypothetical protein
MAIIYMKIFQLGSQDSSVNTMTGYRMDGQVRFLAEARDFSLFSTVSRLALGSLCISFDG